MAFGESAELYDNVRKQYPEQIINKVANCISEAPDCSLILDIGCGTGIASRQLSQIPNKSIIACDLDADMIRVARQIGGSNISYHVMASNALDFPNISIRAITAFGSFHWFCDLPSLTAIRRVLQPGGRLFIINKDNDAFKQEIYPIISKYCPSEVINNKSNYNPKSILLNNGFTEINEYFYDYTETYTHVDELLQFIQSLKFWEFVQPNDKDNLLSTLRNYLEHKFYENKYVRKVRTTLVWGKKAD